MSALYVGCSFLATIALGDDANLIEVALDAAEYVLAHDVNPPLLSVVGSGTGAQVLADDRALGLLADALNVDNRPAAYDEPRHNAADDLLAAVADARADR